MQQGFRSRLVWLVYRTRWAVIRTLGRWFPKQVDRWLAARAAAPHPFRRNRDDLSREIQVDDTTVVLPRPWGDMSSDELAAFGIVPEMSSEEYTVVAQGLDEEQNAGRRKRRGLE